MEKELIEMYASTKYKSIAPYLRDCALHKEIKIINGIEGVEYELRRIGNNLNQIAHALNGSGYYQYNLITENQKELNKVWQLLRRYLQKQA